jgi:hypothetical protein
VLYAHNDHGDRRLQSIEEAGTAGKDITIVRPMRSGGRVQA